MSRDLEADLRMFLLSDGVRTWLYAGATDDDERMEMISADAIASHVVDFLAERGVA